MPATSSPSPTPLPLSGVRVLDLSRLLPGPWATWQLVAMGADVLRVESPGVGDYARLTPPMIGGASALFTVLNRGKRSITVDLKTAAGRQLVLELADRADVVFEQFRPGVLDRLGLGWEVLRARKADAILCSLTGYGQTGPLATAAGHDMNYQALAGVLHLQGTADAPTLSTPPMADLAGASAAVSAVLGALLHRERAGEGQHLDVSLTEAVGAFAAPFLAGWNAAVAQGDAPAGRGEALLDGGLAQYSVYRTKDGGHLAVGALEPKFFARFAGVCGHPEWMQVPALPGPRQAELKDAVARAVAGRTREEWEEALSGIDCCVTVVRRPDELAAVQHFRERGALEERGGVSWPASVLGPALTGPPVEPGADTDAVLAELGYGPKKVATLRAAGVVE